MFDGPTVTCPACGDTHAAPGGDADFLKRGVSRCDVCDARIVYGELAMRIVQEPATFDTIDGPMPAMLLRFQDPISKADVFTVKIDPQLAFLHAQGIIAMVRP